MQKLSLPGNMQKLSLVGSIQKLSLVGSIHKLSQVGSIQKLSLPGNMQKLSLPGNIQKLSLAGNIQKLSLVGSIHKLSQAGSIQKLSLVGNCLRQGINMRIPSQGNYRIIVFWRRASTQEAENWSCETRRSYRFSPSQTSCPPQRTLGSAGSWVGGPLSWAAGVDPGPPSDHSVPALQYRQHSESRCLTGTPAL